MSKDNISTGSLESRIVVARNSQEKRRRRTSKQLHQYNVVKVKQRTREDSNSSTATHLWHWSLTKSNTSRKNDIYVVKKLNNMHGTNIRKQSVQRHVVGGSVNALDSRAWLKFKLMQPVEIALLSSLLTFIQLANSEMNKMPDRKTVIKNLKVFIQGGNYVSNRFDHLYN